MTIIEAFQKAENGELITNGILESVNQFFKYKTRGYFDLYVDTVTGPVLLDTVSSFSYGEILSTGWKTINIDGIK